MENPEANRARKKQDYERNREKICARARLRRRQFPDLVRAIKRRHVQKYAERYRQKNRVRLATLKKGAIRTLGGQCSQCGYCRDIRALQIGHINGGGSIERRTLSNYAIYRSIIKEGHQGKYQVLCANCNAIKLIENREYAYKMSGSHADVQASRVIAAGGAAPCKPARITADVSHVKSL